jgi:hypothetical protein
MKRGNDEFGIESICEVATPIIVDNKTGEVIKNPTQLKSINSEKTNIIDKSSIFDILG